MSHPQSEADLLRENAELRAGYARLREAREALSRLGNEPHLGNSRGNVIAQNALAENPAITLGSSELQLIDERDDAVNAFDELVTLLGVETEYSNLRGYKEIISDCVASLEAIRVEERKACVDLLLTLLAAVDDLPSAADDTAPVEADAAKDALNEAIRAIWARGDGG